MGIPSSRRAPATPLPAWEKPCCAGDRIWAWEGISWQPGGRSASERPGPRTPTRSTGIPWRYLTTVDLEVWPVGLPAARARPRAMRLGLPRAVTRCPAQALPPARWAAAEAAQGARAAVSASAEYRRRKCQISGLWCQAWTNHPAVTTSRSPLRATAAGFPTLSASRRPPTGRHGAGRPASSAPTRLTRSSPLSPSMHPAGTRPWPSPGPSYPTRSDTSPPHPASTRAKPPAVPPFRERRLPEQAGARHASDPHGTAHRVAASARSPGTRGNRQDPDSAASWPGGH
jgi:hypothetical protein